MRKPIAARASTVVGVLWMMFVAADAAHAQAEPVQLSLFNPVQIFDESTAIHGFRFNVLYGYNREMQGVDLGFVLNRVRTKTVGLQWGLVNWNEGQLLGVDLGFVNFLEGTGEGGQLGSVNYAAEMTGLQWGLVNYASRVKGLQLGFVNVAGHLEGLQLGLVNVAKNGFLPVFVIFNFAF